MSNTLDVLLKGKDKFFKDKKTVIKKSLIISMFEDAVQSIETDVLPVCESFIKSVDTEQTGILTKKNLDGVGELKVVLNYVKTKEKTVYGYFKNTVIPNLKSLVEHREKLKNVLTNNFPTISTYASFNVKDLSVINLIDNINFLSMYTLDLVNFVIETCRINSNSLKNYEMNKKVLEMIRNNLNPFVLLSTELDKNYLESFIKKLPNCTELIVDSIKEESPELIKRVLEDQGQPEKMMNVNNFTFNPIYHILSGIENFKYNRYLANKDKRERFRLTITQLELEKDGVNDDKINKQIEWYREKEEELTYKITKYENS